jgi:hypothetical protein
MTQRLEIREPRESEWGAIARLADVAVDHLTEAPTQEEWVRARRGFAGWRRHRVVVRDREVAGYGGIEHPGADPAGESVRLFVVTASTGSLEVAEQLYEWALGALEEASAGSVWMREYASDRPLLDFFAERGFTIGEPYDVSGTLLVNCSRSLGG